MIVGAVFIPLAFDPAGTGGINFIQCLEDEIIVYVNATWVCGVDQTTVTELQQGTFANENTEFRPHLVRGTNVQDPIKNFGEYSIRVLEYLPNQFGETSWDYLVPEDYELGGDLEFTAYWFKEDGLKDGELVENYDEKATACLVYPTTGTPLTVIDGMEYDFQEGEDYLIMVNTNWVNAENHDRLNKVSVKHGTTTFPDSRLQHVVHHKSDLPCNSGDEFYNYFWWTLWRPNATEATENISLFIDNTQNIKAGTSMFIDDTTINIIKLSDTHLPNTHWFYDQKNINSTIANSWATPNDATLSFTPYKNNTDWLILGKTQYVQTYADRSTENRLKSTGTVNEFVPFISRQGEAQGVGFDGVNANKELDMKSFARVFHLQNVPQTFANQLQIEDGQTNPNSDKRTSSTLLALNLDRYNEYAWVWTAPQLSLGNAPYTTQVNTISLNSTADDSEVFVLANIGMSDDGIGLRTQFDNSDTPLITDQTTQAYLFNSEINGQDVSRWSLTAMANGVTNGIHTIDVDGEKTGAGVHNVQGRSLLGILMRGNTTGVLPPPPPETVCMELRLMSVDVGEDLSSSITPTHGDWYEQCATTLGGADILRTFTWNFNATVNPFEPEEVGIVQLKRHSDNSTSDDYDGTVFVMFGELQWIKLP